MVPYIPVHTKILQNSLIRITSMFTFVLYWYTLICTVKFQNYDIKFPFEKLRGQSLGKGLV